VKDPEKRFNSQIPNALAYDHLEDSDLATGVSLACKPNVTNRFQQLLKST
jgi:hypothetical protein